jgi:hypothetical protein
VELGAVVCEGAECITRSDVEDFAARIRADVNAMLGVKTPPAWSIRLKLEPGEVEAAVRRVIYGEIIVIDDPAPELAACSVPCCALHPDDSKPR